MESHVSLFNKDDHLQCDDQLQVLEISRNELLCIAAAASCMWGPVFREKFHFNVHNATLQPCAWRDCMLASLAPDVTLDTVRADIFLLQQLQVEQIDYLHPGDQLKLLNEIENRHFMK